ncbi:hypothetical protein FACS1894152_0280 [Bacilli bacterium]|nr:hypothetical protein FACS1894152_0280 [Bacilli bacterium]
MKIGKIILNSFLTFTFFFNFLLFTSSGAVATGLTGEVVNGARDRVRKFDQKYKRFNIKTFRYDYYDDLEFKYNDSGFVCKPGGLKFAELKDLFDIPDVGNTGNSSVDDEIISRINDAGDLLQQIVSGAAGVALSILFTPVLCVGTLKAFGDIAGGDNLKGGIEAILLLFTTAGLSWIEDKIYGEDDYNLDPLNLVCLPATIGMFVSCTAMMIVFKLGSTIGWHYALAIILDISIKTFIAKQIFKLIEFKRAEAVFGKLSMCGDEWFTYGNSILEEEKLEGLNNYSISINDIRRYFPTRGSFNGSYSYDLNKCFVDNEVSACQKIFRDDTITNDESTENNITSKMSLVNKPYRELFYEGVEFSYDGCVDPRPERQQYNSAGTNKRSQLYYFRGSDVANFACERFQTDNSQEYADAFHCCMEASLKLICIKAQVGSAPHQYTHKMCEIGWGPSKCKINHTAVEGGVKVNRTAADPPINTADPAPADKVSEAEAQRSDNRANFCPKLRTNTIGDTRICPTSCDSETTCRTVGTSCLKAYQEYKSNCSADDSIPFSSSTEDAGTEGEKYKVTKLKIRESQFEKNKYCVETYNYCPYNFRIMGGSEQYGQDFIPSYESGHKVKEEGDVYVEDTKSDAVKQYNVDYNCTFDEDGNRHCMGKCAENNGDEEEIYACYNKPSNFCQIDRHCTKVHTLVEVEETADSPYIDVACLNHVGSSHNFTNYAVGVAGTSSRSTRLLTAPLVECMVETIKNMLLNRAGHTKCVDPRETPLESGECEKTNTVYKRGQYLDGMPEYQNTFRKLKRFLIGVVKAVMALAVMLYGYNIIILQKGTKPEELMKFILKLICVSYFSMSVRWIPPIFDGVYKVYNIVTAFAMRIVMADEIIRDMESGKDIDPYDPIGNPKSVKYSGCYFSKHTLINNNFDRYGDRQYLAVFDTLDCKISRYFGYYTARIDNPPIVAIFIAGIFTFGLAILMILPFILMFVALLFFAIKASYMFISSSLTITILLFLSPILIPMMLFERTKGFFDKWIKQIIINVMSPLFLFMSLSLFFVVFDKYYVADAIFKGKREPIRDVFCGEICKIGTRVWYIGGKRADKEKARGTCTASRGEVINLKLKAPICVTQHGSDVQVDTGIGIINFLVKDFAGLPGLRLQMAGFFTMFIDIIFLLILIFIFDQLGEYVNKMSEQIVGGKGIDDGSGLPSLGDVMGAVASVGAYMANLAKDNTKDLPNKAKRIKNWVTGGGSGGGGGGGGGGGDKGTEKREEGQKGDGSDSGGGSGDGNGGGRGSTSTPAPPPPK